MARLSLLAILVLSIALASGCGLKQPRMVSPDHRSRTMTAALNSSPLAGESVVLLPMERDAMLPASVGDNVLEALAEQHRRTLVEGGFVKMVYSSLTEAEAKEPGRPFLMLRGTLQTYEPTSQTRWGANVRTGLTLAIKYDIWNPAKDRTSLTLRATEVPEVMFMDTATASGEYDEAITRRDLAQLTEASFMRFNREMIGNRQVVTLAKMR